MAKRLDQVIVIDIESTCWEGDPSPGQESDIIEIGLCILDVATAARVESRSILVIPERSKVSEYCTRLTTLTQEQVETGVTFAEACAILKREFMTKERWWASYGDYDRRQFERQCQALNVGYPFGPGHINVKSLFAIVFALPHEVGLDEALSLMQLPLEGTHHRGVDDAWNIGNVLSRLVAQFRH